MTFFSKRKRKNDDPPRFPAWIVVLIAIGAVVIVALLFQPTSTQTITVTPSRANFELTATYIVQQATQIAQGTPQSDATLDPMLITATYIIQQATSLAQGTPQPIEVQSGNIDPLYLTATGMVKQATAQANTPGS